MPSALGEKIRNLRKELGLTLDQLADDTGSSKSYIWELENKNPPRPSAEKLIKIADRLQTTIEFLLDDGDAVTKEDAADASFYREYKKMTPETKEEFRAMVKVFKDK